MADLKRRAELTKASESKEPTESDNQMMFFSFGMFIVDTIEHPFNPDIPTKHNLPGGAGLYALLGARLLTPPPYSRFLSWILDAGHDLPPSITTQIRSWQTSTRIRHDPARSTTAAWNGYGGAHDPEFRSFKYLTPKRRLDVEDLDNHELNGIGWHMVCSAQRAADIVRKLDSRRGDKTRKKVVVWEPIPDLCSPEERDRVMTAARLVEVVSPNADELRAFFGATDNDNIAADDEELVTQLMGWDLTTTTISKGARNTACIVREGKDGSTIYFPPGYTTTTTTSSSSNISPPPPLPKLHLPAYHTPNTPLSTHVHDPTGGGNTYLGALAVVLAYLSASAPIPPPITLLTNHTSHLLPHHPPQYTSLLTASIAACIAASFAIEQHGVPDLQQVTDTKINEEGAEESEVKELWGGEGVMDRITMYLAREGGEIEAQIGTRTTTATATATTTTTT